MENLIDCFYFALGFYSLVLILVGTPLNFLCFYIFKRRIPNRSNATIIVFSYLALIELVVPFTWNLNYFIRELIWKPREFTRLKNLEQHSWFVCKLLSYGAYFSLQSAAWLKTLATLTRCVSLHQDWSIRKFLSNAKTIRRIVFLTIFSIGLINAPIFFVPTELSTFNHSENQTSIVVQCYQRNFFRFWETVHLFLYNLLPFVSMILCNISIIRHVDRSRRRTRRSKSNSLTAQRTSSNSQRFSQIRRSSLGGSRLTKTLVFISLFFIVFTSPSPIFYRFVDRKTLKNRHLITMALSNLATTSHVVSFLIYWVTSKDFRDAVILLFVKKPSSSERMPIADRQNNRRVTEDETQCDALQMTTVEWKIVFIDSSQQNFASRELEHLSSKTWSLLFISKEIGGSYNLKHIDWQTNNV